MNTTRLNKKIQAVEFLFGKFIIKYPFINVYYGLDNKDNNCLLVNIELKDDANTDNGFWDELYEIETLLSVVYDDILFTRNEELFKIASVDKTKIKPFNLNNMTLKEKINEIIKLVKDIETEYNVFNIILRDIKHPISSGCELDICTITHTKSGYDNADKIEISYYDEVEEEWRTTFFTEHNNLNETTSQSADSIIDALNKAKIYYHRSKDVLYGALMRNGKTTYDISVFQQLLSVECGKLL